MPIAEFAATATLLQQQYLPQFTFDANSTPTTASVAAIITKKAAEVSGILTSHGIAPDGIDNAGEPISFQYLQDLVLVGTAAHVARAFGGHLTPDELIAQWRREWRDGLAALRDPQLAKQVLADSKGLTTTDYVRTHVQVSGDVPTTAADVDVEDPDFLHGMDL